MRSYKLLGALFIMISGLIYSLERGFSMISTSLIMAGFYSGKMSGEVPEVEIHTLFDNFYVPLFFIVGLILIVYGFLKK